MLSVLAQEGVNAYKLAVKEIARSGKPGDLIDKFGISTRHIIRAVAFAHPAWPTKRQHRISEPCMLTCTETGKKPPPEA